MTSVIEFTDATKDYGSGKRIGPVSFSVESGEIMGFLGPNGSGKTTCIRLLLGLMRPSEGAVWIRGFDPVREHRKAMRRVGYSPELPNIQTFLSPRELLSLVASELDLSRSEVKKEIKDSLEIVGLSDYENTKVSKLSKGMVQRLSIAQALIGSPDILVLDEPMIGLDPAGASHFRSVFREFAKERGGTIFLSSHIMSEVEALCTSVCMIHNGRLLFKTKTEEVPANVLGSAFLIVEVEPMDERLIRELSEIDGVESVKTIAARALELSLRPGLEIRPVISEKIVSSGAKLYSISYPNDLLERAYLAALKKS